MIQITPQMRILLSIKAVDFRKGIDGLAGNCRQVLESAPSSGCVFVFRNSRGTAIKALMYDGQGFWLFQERLSKRGASGHGLPGPAARTEPGRSY